ncbi:MAG TPA: calcium-binding protein, partial [Burkholderiales bacterium]|nr:calcium-binding protein [Burkholderiales bacterium]
DDYLFGDTDYVPGVIDWDIQRSPSGALVLNGVSGTAANQPGTDQIYAGAGDDYVDAEGGKDIIYGEAGDDRIRAGEGDDFVDGGSGSDELLGGGGHDMMFGAAGDDRMFGGEAGAQDDSDDWMWGGEGRDVMSGSAGADHLFGEAGDDELHGDADDVPRAKQGDDDLFGGAGNDYLRGYAGSDLLDGGDGADELHGDEGNDALFGGDGIDLLHGEAGNDLLDGAGGDDAIGGEDGDDVLYGGEGSDTLVGAAGADRLRGDAGDDRLEGDAGNDVLDGGEGADIMAGGLGHDIFYADAADKLFDEDGDAELIFTDGTTEAELEPITFDDNGTLYQGLARDGQVVYTSLADRRSTNTRYRFADGSVLTQEQFLGGHLVEAQALLGDANANTLAGFAGDDNLSGQAGRDVLRGYAGDDWLDGGADDDSLSGGTGNDGLSGGAGNDVYRFDRGDGQDVIDERGESPSSDTLRLGEGVQPGEVQLVREASGDLLVKIAGTGDQIRVLGFYREPAQSIERIEFANGAVIDLPALLALPIAAITGSDNADVLVGTARDETLLGLAGNDVLEGDAGADRAEGGAGADRYVFGRGMGADRLLDTAGTSTLALAADLRLSDLAAHRVGDDLLLQIRGTSDSALIEGYYTTPQSWQIDDGTATLASLESIVAQTQAREADYVQALRDDYKVRAISDIAAPYLANGYRFSAPGILVHAPFQTWVQARVSKTVQTTSTVVTTLHGDGSPSTTYTLDSSYHHEDWDVSVGVLVDGRVTITNAVQLSDAAEIAPVHAWQYSDPASRVIVNVQWDRLPIFRGRTQFLHGIANSHDPVTGDASTSSSNTTIGFSSGSASGRAIGFSSVVPITDARPSSAYADLRVVRAQAVVEEIVAGAADNRISGDDSTLVDAGTGNDIVQGAGFQYGGAGDDQLSDGRVLLGGAGNDVLLAGQYLAGGAGDDLMEGDGGQTRYVLRADDVGHDLIADFSDESDAIKGWYYGTMLRISEWQARDVYGGAYRFDNDGHFEKVNARVAAWLRDPAAPPESAFDNWQQMYGGAQEHWLSAKQTVLTIPSTLRYFEPLPPFPVSSAHDYTALAPFYASGSVALDTVELPLGATLENLQATLIEIPFTTAQGSVQAYAALELALGLNQSVRIVLPHADDALGSGIERLKFADGRVLSIGDLVARLGPNANLDPQRQANVLALDDLNTLFHNAGTGYRAEGKGGDDQITGSAYGDALYGDKGNDRLNGHDGSDTLDGGLGADLLDGGAGDDALFGGEGDDLLRGGAGNDTVYADEGHDLALG